MTLFGRLIILFISGFLWINLSFAGEEKTLFYRNFFLPTYHGERLAYCACDGKTCGLAVASLYCRMLGYQCADKQLIDYNVGLTNFIASSVQCKNWRCHGFKAIRCVSHLEHIPPAPYHYRLRKFVYPRYEHYRIAWCYDGRIGCGLRAAFSFCRRKGFLKTKQFAIEKSVAATKAIANQKLCFGAGCDAFKFIVCYR